MIASKGRICAVALAALAFFALSIRADVAPYPGPDRPPRPPAPGPDRPVEDATPPAVEVAMPEETVELLLGKDSALVKASFVLRNEGQTVEIDMGFPDVPIQSLFRCGALPGTADAFRIRDFSAVCDGIACRSAYRESLKREDLADARKVRRRVEELARIRGKQEEVAKKLAAARAGRDAGKEARLFEEMAALERAHREAAYAGWFVWTVEFPAGRTRKVEVSFRAPYVPASVRAPRGECALEYVLKSGAAWKGPIGKATIVAKPEGEARPEVLAAAPAGWTRSGDVLRWELRDFEPDQDVRIDFKPTEGDGKKGEK
jgi:hypothetical protein